MHACCTVNTVYSGYSTVNTVYSGTVVFLSCFSSVSVDPVRHIQVYIYVIYCQRYRTPYAILKTYIKKSLKKNAYSCTHLSGLYINGNFYVDKPRRTVALVVSPVLIRPMGAGCFKERTLVELHLYYLIFLHYFSSTFWFVHPLVIIYYNDFGLRLYL